MRTYKEHKEELFAGWMLNTDIAASDVCWVSVLLMKNCRARIKPSMAKKLLNDLLITLQTFMGRDSQRAISISLFSFISSSMRFSTHEWKIPNPILDALPQSAKDYR